MFQFDLAAFLNKSVDQVMDMPEQEYIHWAAWRKITKAF